MHGEGKLHVGMNSALQFAEAADTADEVDPVVGFRVQDAENGRQDQVLKDRDVQ